MAAASCTQVLHGELLIRIATYLDPLTLIAATATSHAFQQVCISEAAWINSKLVLTATSTHKLVSNKSYNPRSLQQLHNLYFLPFDEDGVLLEWHKADCAQQDFFNSLPPMLSLRSIHNIWSIYPSEVFQQLPALETLTFRDATVSPATLDAVLKLEKLTDLHIEENCHLNYVALYNQLSELAPARLHVHLTVENDDVESFGKPQRFVAASHYLHTMTLEMPFKQAAELISTAEELVDPPADSRLQSLSLVLWSMSTLSDRQIAKYVQIVVSVLRWYQNLKQAEVKVSHFCTYKCWSQESEAIVDLRQYCQSNHIELTLVDSG